MSAHNHDEEFIRKTTKKPAKSVGKTLQNKVEDRKDEAIRTALLSADISGLSREAAQAKLKNIVDEILSE